MQSIISGETRYDSVHLEQVTSATGQSAYRRQVICSNDSGHRRSMAITAVLLCQYRIDCDINPQELLMSEVQSRINDSNIDMMHQGMLCEGSISLLHPN